MKINMILETGWECYAEKVAHGLLIPENEKMMQLQLSSIFQSLAVIYEYEQDESIKIHLEVSVRIKKQISKSIDIVIAHTSKGKTAFYPVELKCFRLRTRDGKSPRGAQNLGMYDYWEDIESVELYSDLENYEPGYQFTLTDDTYYVKTEHRGPQVRTYSTAENRDVVTGILEQKIASREGRIRLKGVYSTSKWKEIGNFYFISQRCPSKESR